MSDKKRILIVEDETMMITPLASKFEHAGFEVIKAFDGEDGLEKAMKEKPDLVMLDILMPKMDGMAVMRKIREDKHWGSDVPIVMLTNLNDPEKVSEAANYQVFDFLVKTDWKLEDIINFVKQKLDANFINLSK